MLITFQTRGGGGAPAQEEVWGFIEEVVWPQYGETWGRWRRRGGQNLEDPEMFLKSSLSLLILKVGSSTPLSLSSFTFTFWWLCHCGWSHSLSVYHLKRRRLPWKLVEINVQNLKFNSMVPKSPKQQKTKPVDEYEEIWCCPSTQFVRDDCRPYQGCEGDVGHRQDSHNKTHPSWFVIFSLFNWIWLLMS